MKRLKKFISMNRYVILAGIFSVSVIALAVSPSVPFISGAGTPRMAEAYSTGEGPMNGPGPCGNHYGDTGTASGSGSTGKGNQTGTQGGTVTSGDGSNPCACGGHLADSSEPKAPWYAFLFGRDAYAKGDTTGTKIQRWVCDPCPPADYCSNIAGTQSSMPAGYTRIGTACYPEVTATLLATPKTLYWGQSTELNWTSANATSCTGGNFSTGGLTSGHTFATPDFTTGYSVSCTGPGGTAHASASVTVVRPTATLNCTPNPIDQGASCSLAWSSANSISCSGSGFDTSGQSSGSVSVSPSQTTAYAVTCTNGYGKSITANDTVTVRPPAVSLTANPPRVVQGQSSSVTWSGTNMRSCTLTNTETGAVVDQKSSPTSVTLTDSYNTGPLGHDASFLLSCSNAAGALTTSTLVIPVAPNFQEF